MTTFKKRPKIGFQDQLSFNTGQSIAECSMGSILQYFRPSLSYHLSLRSLFCLFLSGRFTQVLLFVCPTGLCNFNVYFVENFLPPTVILQEQTSHM